MKLMRYVSILQTTALLASCQLSSHVSLRQESVFTLSGHLANFSSASSSSNSTLTCTTPTASVYQIDSSGNRVLPAIASQVLAADGGYSFDVTSTGLQFSNQVPLVSYVVVVSGCTNGVYIRPVTGEQNQDITTGSSLLAYVLDTSNKAAFASALKTSPASVQALISSLQPYGSFDDAYQALSTNTTLASQFLGTFGVAPTALQTAAPEIKSSDIPTAASEQVTLAASVNVAQWSSGYTPAYEWRFDASVVSTSASLAYVPTANQQGTHTLTLTIGSDDGTGHVDTSKDTKVVSNTLLISNNILPSAPAFSVTTPVVSGSVPINSRSLTVSISTGASMNLCASFSNLLLTEDPSPPASTTPFPISCTQSGSQTQAYSLTSANDGLKTLYLWAIDASGTVSLTPAQFSFYLDTAPPTATIATVPPSITNATSQLFTFSANDNGGVIDHFLCKLDTGSYAACSSPKTYSSLTEGDHTFYLEAVDTANNTSAPVSVSWHVDLTAPVLTLSSKPATMTNQLVASFGFSAADSGGGGVAGYMCSVDGGAYASCSSPFTTTLLTGNHSFYVRAQDTAGNTSAIQSYSWTIDTIAPTVSIVSKPPTLTNSQTGNFSFTGSDTGGGSVASYECLIDNGSFGACSSPQSYSSLAAGAHTVQVRAIDTAGNTGSATSYSWTIDLTTPMASITSNPNTLTNSQSASFTFSATAPPSGSITGYECQLDSSSFVSCTTPANYSSLTQGSHTFAVRSIDNNNNRSAATSYTWTIDLTKPVLTISAQPSTPTSQTLGSFTFSATDTGGGVVAGFECNIDSAGFVACSSPKTYSSLTDGSHTVAIHALDTAGNISLDQTITWTVDTTAPAVSITSKPAAITNLTTAHFVFSATDAGTITGYTCTQDGGTAAACTSPVDLSSLAAGAHSMSVQATDQAGNVSVAAAYSWIIDTTPPTVTIGSGPAAITNATGATFTFTGSDTGGGAVASYSCQLDSGSFVACTSPVSYSGLTSIAHTFNVKALDTAGNTSTVASAGWTIDTTAPTLSITTPASPALVAPASSLSSFTLGGSCSENGINVLISGAVSSSAACTSGSWSTSLNLASLSDGSASITASQTDAAGNTTNSSTSVIVDKTQPTVTLGSFNTGAYMGGAVANITWTATDTNMAATPIALLYSTNGGSSWVSIVSGLANSGTYSWTLPSVDSASVKVKVTALDKAGNLGSALSSGTLTIDSTAPILSAMTVNGGSTSPITSNNVPISLSATDNFKITQFCFKYNTTTAPILTDSCWIPVASAGSAPGTSLNINNYYFRVGFGGGSYSINAWIRDEAGNISTLTSTSGVDTGSVTYAPASPPVMTTVLASSNAIPSMPPSSSDLTITSGNDVYIYWQASGASGLPANAIALTYSTNDSTWTAIPGASGLPNSQGTGCTLFGSYTGCFKWATGSPTSSYYKIQAKVTDNASYSALNLSPSINASAINFITGNTNTGTGASAATGVFLTTVQGDVRQTDQYTLAVHPNGTIYFKDTARGILKIDPATGLTSVFLAKTNSLSGDGGPVSSATAVAPDMIALDHNNNLLVYDYSRIRLINLAVNPPTISTIIGGGSDTSDTVAVATNISLTGFSVNSSYAGDMYPLANGDILFRPDQTGSPKIRWYHASSGSMTTVYLSGTGLFPAPGNTINANADCYVISIVPILDTSGNPTGFLGDFQASPIGGGKVCAYDASYHSYNSVFDLTGAVQTTLISAIYTNYMLGRNGSIYGYSRQSGNFAVYNPTSLNWTTIDATGSGNCADGTAFSSCPSLFDDVFIDLSGKFYFADNGMIRTVSDSGTLLTIAGQSLNYGDGLPPLQARFGKLTTFGLWNDGASDRLIVLDSKDNFLREISLSSSGTLTTIAGNGSASYPSTVALATATYLPNLISTSTVGNLALDTVGDVFMGVGNNEFGYLKRSTGKWVYPVAGGGSTWYYSASENTVGTSLKYSQANGYLSTVGFGNGQAVVSVSDSSANSNNAPAFKLIDMSSFKESSLTSYSGVSSTTTQFSADGTVLSNCDVPLQNNTNVGVAYDSTSAVWYATSAGSQNEVYKLTPGGTLANYFYVGNSVRSFAYLRVNATTENFYVCLGSGSNQGKIQKTVMVNGAVSATTILNWPIATMTCVGNTMSYSTSRNSLIFIYLQNGMYGVAEYLNP